MSEAESASGQQLAGRVYYLIFWEPIPDAGDRRAVHPHHIAKVKELEADGRLFAAGPILGDDGMPSGRGMFILRVKSIEEAHEIAQADPYFKAGFRTYRVETWRRSEGAMNLRVNVGANRVEID